MSIRPSLYGTPDFPVPLQPESQSPRVTSGGREVYAEICMDIPSVTYRLLETIRYGSKRVRHLYGGQNR